MFEKKSSTAALEKYAETSRNVVYVKLNFKDQLKYIFHKTNKTIGLLCKLQSILPRPLFVIINKWFVRPILDNDSVIYDHAYNSSFQKENGNSSV